MSQNNRIMLLLDEIFNRNLAVTPQYLSVFLGALKRQGKIDFSQLEIDGESLESAQLVDMAAGFSREIVRPYRIQDGAAIIPIHGSLTHRFGYLTPTSGMTGYDGIRANIKMAQEDPEVKGVAYDLRSPGGSVDGLFDLTDWAKDFVTKPTRAIVDPQACSAAQLVASIADTVTLSRTDRMGSIGAISAHTDLSKMLEGKGEKITLITAGARKAEFSPYEALPADVFNRKQAELEELRTMFVQTLVDNRGCDFNALMATEAAVLSAKEAVELKLADKIMSPADSLEEFIDQINPTTTGALPMPDPKPEEQTDTNATALDAPSQMSESAIRAEATTAERERIEGILMSEEGKSRSESALNIALKTSMNVEEGISLLSTLPAQASLETTAPATSPFDKMMTSIDPEVPADGEGADGLEARAKSKNSLISAHSKLHA